MHSRLAPGVVWPVDPQTLRSALGEAATSVEVNWLFWIKQPSDRPVEATWTPLPEVLPGLQVTIRPIATDDLQVFRRTAQPEILHDLAVWCRQALAAPEGWRLMRHNRRWTVHGSEVHAAERSGVDALPWRW
jgi:hypothetical protein